MQQRPISHVRVSCEPWKHNPSCAFACVFACVFPCAFACAFACVFVLGASIPVLCHLQPTHSNTASICSLGRTKRHTSPATPMCNDTAVKQHTHTRAHSHAPNAHTHTQQQTNTLPASPLFFSSFSSCLLNDLPLKVMGGIVGGRHVCTLNNSNHTILQQTQWHPPPQKKIET